MLKVKSRTHIVLICLFLIPSDCNANQESNVEKIIINLQLKEKIMASPLNVNLHRRDGTEVTAYLYASDAIDEEVEDDSCATLDVCQVMSKRGSFFIYLYDLSTKSFSSHRTKVFSDFTRTSFRLKGADLIVLPGIKNIKPDVMIIGQFGGSYFNFYEAYSFSENNIDLENYEFVDKDGHEFKQLGGLLVDEADKDKLGVTIFYNELGINNTLKMNLYLSEKDGKLHFSPELI